MDAKTIQELETSWEPEGGVFWRLREGTLDTNGFEELVSLLDRIVVTEDTTFPRRFVSVVWFMPIFMEWQRERVQESGGDMREFARYQNRITGAVQRILGVP